MAIDNSTEYILQTLATLAPTIDALLKSKIPNSPIVKEKMEQMEKIISLIPLDQETTATSWHEKLASWWVAFAMQQADIKEVKEERVNRTTNNNVNQPEPEFIINHVIEEAPEGFDWASTPTNSFRQNPFPQRSAPSSFQKREGPRPRPAFQWN